MSLEKYRQARDRLLALRTDYEAAREQFTWPRLAEFNWALDHFDELAAGNPARALWIVEADGSEATRSFDALYRRSNQVANYLRDLGLRRGDRMLIMLGNCVPLWEAMLAAMKLGVVMVPATTLLTTDDLRDRITRGRIRCVLADAASAPKFAGIDAELERICVTEDVPGWHHLGAAAACPERFSPEGPTRADDALFLYFTSGTTSQPKLVHHTHASYPVGMLSTVYWLGLTEGDVHWNISSPGWAKHAWSCFFAPWTVGACVFIHNNAPFDAAAALEQLVRCRVTSLCAPPTVWRMLVQQPLEDYPVALREVVGAGEPLNPEIIQRVQRAWNLTIRDGYGQTETTAQIGNPPGQPVKPGSMGRPLPGFAIELLDAEGQPARQGEVCISLANRPVGLMQGYLDDEARTRAVMHGGYYHTGDVAERDEAGYITFIGRTDDVFKASDYRISPFELESVLIEHEAVAEAAVVPSPDPLRLAVPKAYCVLAAGHQPGPAAAADILAFCRARLAPYKRIRRIEFAELPKTVSGKIRRVELRGQEEQRPAAETRRENEYWEEDL